MTRLILVLTFLGGLFLGSFLTSTADARDKLVVFGSYSGGQKAIAVDSNGKLQITQ